MAIRTWYDAEGVKDHHRRQWAETLKSIYAASRDIKSYISICDETELLPVDCEILAGMLLSRRKPAEALQWVEKGLEIQSNNQLYRGSSYVQCQEIFRYGSCRWSRPFRLKIPKYASVSWHDPREDQCPQLSN